MAEWEPRAGVSWKSAPLFNFRASENLLQRSLGAPQAVDADSNGIGPVDVWALRFPCGLELCLWRLKMRPDGSLIEAADDPCIVEVHANAAEERHIRFHLPLQIADISYWEPSPLAPEPLRWRVLRQDESGNKFEVAKYPSRCEALANQVRFESKGHKQTYWVEESEDAGAKLS